MLTEVAVSTDRHGGTGVNRTARGGATVHTDTLGHRFPGLFLVGSLNVRAYSQSQRKKPQLCLNSILGIEPGKVRTQP